MHPASETLRHRRIQILMNNASTYLWTSVGLSLICGLVFAVNGQYVSGLTSTGLISLVSLAGIVSVTYSRNKLKANPLWSPIPWFFTLLAANGVLWGLSARHGGLCLTLAVAQAGLAGTYLCSHGRLVASVIGPIALIPVPFFGSKRQPNAHADAHSLDGVNCPRQLAVESYDAS